jgi:hypothetical protein
MLVLQKAVNREAVDYAFSQLNRPQWILPIFPQNGRPARPARRLGLQLEVETRSGAIPCCTATFAARRGAVPEGASIPSRMIPR